MNRKKIVQMALADVVPKWKLKDKRLAQKKRRKGEMTPSQALLAKYAPRWVRDADGKLSPDVSHISDRLLTAREGEKREVEALMKDGCFQSVPFELPMAEPLDFPMAEPLELPDFPPLL